MVQGPMTRLVFCTNQGFAILDLQSDPFARTQREAAVSKLAESRTATTIVYHKSHLLLPLASNTQTTSAFHHIIQIPQP